MKKKRAKRRPVIRSEDEIKWRVVYAEPSEESEEIYKDLMRYLYRFGVSKGLFCKKKN